MTLMIAALTAALAVGPAFAQATPPQNPPAQPPAANQPAAQPQAEAPKPFPEGAKVGFIDLQVIASNSAEGKAATSQIQALQKKKTDEINEKTKQAQAIQSKLQQGGTVLSEQARAQNERELQKLQRELQAMQEDAQEELQEMTQKLQDEFQNRLNPIIEQVASEKGLHVVFSVRDSGIVWAYGGIDISGEVIKRFDAAAKTAPKK
ncbi:MAG TPA: OmpH family outer membrane protein [Vicinamibacterales bacterium]|nr:OmpH family outer membrane protein [Vicinamibacterales bacterium]